MALDPYLFQQYSPRWMAQRRQRYVSQGRPGCSEGVGKVGEAGGPPTRGPTLCQESPLELSVPLTCSGNFYNQRPSYVADNKGV